MSREHYAVIRLNWRTRYYGKLEDVLALEDIISKVTSVDESYNSDGGFYFHENDDGEPEIEILKKSDRVLTIEEHRQLPDLKREA